MPDYGVTNQGFVLKRMDTILEEIHSDLTEGFGVDTRLSGTSFLDTLVTTFAGQIADLWETAQDSYYAKYPATATGVNLDHAVQYGGIRRMPNKLTCYPLHCTGDDGAYIREEAIVATNTMPEVRLYSADEFQITRDNFNAVCIKVAVVENEAVYTVTITYYSDYIHTLSFIIFNTSSSLILPSGDFKYPHEVKHAFRFSIFAQLLMLSSLSSINIASSISE